MTDNVLPEEKLLRLIRGEKKSKQNGNDEPAVKGISSLQKQRKTKPQALRFNQRFFKKAIPSALIFSFFYLLASFIYPIFIPKTISLLKMDKKPPMKVKKEKKAIDQKPLDFYLQVATSKKIFSATHAQDSANSVGAATADLVKDINLVGIISGPDAQAVIEDKRAQKTYYLRKGQFAGELQLENILEGKIILNYNNQRFELYL